MNDAGSSPAGGWRPLAGLRILDFFWLIAGPLTSRIFADLGADVIKVESGQRPDEIRVGGVRREGDRHPDAATVFAECNSHKRAITLNLGTARGVEVAKRLAAVSDIVTNNFTGERMDRWGLGYEDLRRVNPALIVMSMPAYGVTGPYRRWGANGKLLAAGAGFAKLMGFPGRPPVGPGSLYPDFTNPFHGATALFAALHHRARTGEGQFIDMGQYQANVSLLDTAVLDYLVNGIVPTPAANRSPLSCPHGVYRCTGEDAWIAVEAPSDAAWQALCGAIGRPDLAADAALATLAGRTAHADAIDAAISEWTGCRTPWEAMDQLHRAGVPAGVVQTLADMLDRDPWLSREHFQPVQHPSGYDFTVHRLPFRVDGRPVEAGPHPSVGADNQAVYGDLLGMSNAEIEQLTAEGVLA